MPIKKARLLASPLKSLMKDLIRGDGFSHDVDAAAVFIEQHFAVLEGEQCPIAADADVFACGKFTAALTDDDAAGGDEFATERFNAKPFADAVASVANAALTFFMCHKFLKLGLKLNFFDLDDRQFLAVADGLVIALAAFHLESEFLFAALVFHDISDDARA